MRGSVPLNGNYETSAVRLDEAIFMGSLANTSLTINSHLTGRNDISSNFQGEGMWEKTNIPCCLHLCDLNDFRQTLTDCNVDINKLSSYYILTCNTYLVSFLFLVT